MKRKKRVLFITLIALVVVMAGAFGVVVLSQKTALNNSQEVREKSYDELGIRTFADWTTCEVLKNVPVMLVNGTKIGTAVNYGANNWTIDVNGSTLSDYKNYLNLLETAGFTKYVDNGEKGLADSVYTATYTRNEVILTVTHIVKWDKTYIAACNDMPLSEHLLYDESYVSNITESTKTTLHMMELYDFGNSFVIQLKNGHFIVNDGGAEQDAPYLFDYLESLTPEGEIPVIEAWIISHAHGDHIGVLKSVLTKPEYAKRVYVEGVYYNVPGEETTNKFGSGNQSGVRYVEMAYKFYKTSEGVSPKLYRLNTGQRYYFCDVIVDVPLTQDQILYENHYRDFNDTSTWLMYTIEGQKFLLSGDADIGASRVVMSMYDKEYFELDIFTAFHHGINVWDPFTDYCTLKTVLYPCYRTGSNWMDGTEYAMEEENAHLREAATECLAFGRGTQVLTFPYKIGTAKQLEPLNWTYHANEREFHHGRMENY